MNYQVQHLPHANKEDNILINLVNQACVETLWFSVKTDGEKQYTVAVDIGKNAKHELFIIVNDEKIIAIKSVTALSRKIRGFVEELSIPIYEYISEKMFTSDEQDKIEEYLGL